MNQPGFWDNIEEANKLNKQLTLLKKETREYRIRIFRRIIKRIRIFFRRIVK